MIALDITSPAAVLERARYLTTLHGRGGGRWAFSSYCIPQMLEQIERGELSDYYRERLTEEVPAEVVAGDVGSPRQPSPADGCGGKGYYAHFDTDYDCSGCYGCRHRSDPWVLGAWAIGAFAWGVGTKAERERLELGVRGMQALSRIRRGCRGCAVARPRREPVARRDGEGVEHDPHRPVVPSGRAPRQG